MESEFLAKYIQKDLENEYCIIDIGANVGLVTLQTLNLIRRKLDVYTFEPIKLHNDCIQLNLSGHANLRLFNANKVALGAENSETKIYTEISNKGNTSLHYESMKGIAITEEKIIVESTLEKMEEIVCTLPNSRFVIKMDIQGFEVEVLKEFPTSLISKTQAMVIEVLSAPNLLTEDVDEILEKLQGFSKVRLNHPNGKEINLSKLRSIWLDGSNSQRNLFLSRN